MKIGFMSENLKIHGLATFTISLSQWLQAEGHDVTVISVGRGEWWSRLSELGIEAICIEPKRWESVVNHAHRLARWLKTQPFDLLVVNVGSIYSRPLQLCLHLLPDTLPILLALHNDDPAVYEVAAINSAAWNCALAGSPKVQQTALARLASKVIHCIPYGIQLPTDAQLEERLGYETPLRLLFVGRLVDHQKGIFRLPAILCECRKRQIPVHLTVIGDGPDREQLIRLLNEASVSDIVELQGSQSLDTVRSAMRTHHLFLLPSNFEGLPLVLLDAQAQGCVPIAARLAGITEHALQEGINGILVKPDDVAGYVSAIETMLDPVRWRAFSVAGIQFAWQQFALQTMGARYLQIFHALLKGEHPLLQQRSALPVPFTLRDYVPVSLLRKMTSFVKRFRIQAALRWSRHQVQTIRRLRNYGTQRKVRSLYFGFSTYLRYRSLPRRSDRSDKTLLVMDSRVMRPEDNTLGRANDMYNRLLQQMGWRVFLMSYLPGWDLLQSSQHGAHWDEPYAVQLRQQGFVVLDGWLFRRRRQAWLRHNANAFNCVLFRFPDVAEAYLPFFREHSQAKILYLAHDLSAVRKQREYEVTGDPAAQQAANHFTHVEDALFRISDALLTFSHEEAAWLQQHYGAKVFHIPLFSYTVLPVTCPTPPTKQTMLFVANFAHTPNSDGLCWFVQSCLPLLLEQCPSIKIWVVGTYISDTIRALQSNHLTLLGKVSDPELTALYRQTRVVIAPLRFGAGVKGKVIEALAHGVPVVTTQIGIEGVPGLAEVVPPTDTPEAMAAELIRLLTDDREWQRRSTAGQHFAQEHFSVQAAQTSLEAIFSWLEEGHYRIQTRLID